MTITNNALNLTVQDLPPPRHLVAKTGDLFQLVHFRTLATSDDIWWLLMLVLLAQAGGMHPTIILFCYVSFRSHFR